MEQLLNKAGLTEGEAKVYLALLELGTSTTGPIIEKSGTSRSFIYNILDKLIKKGLASYIVKGEKNQYQAAPPQKILDYMDKRKREIENDKDTLKKSLKHFEDLQKKSPETDIQVYEGYRGIQTAFEKYHQRCKKGDDTYTFGVPPFQEEKYHTYWEEDHALRDKEGIINKMLFNKATDPKILKGRNKFKLCTARYMDSNIKTPAWILSYKNVSVIFLQDKTGPVAIEIINQQIADTFQAYFHDYWNRSLPVK